MRSIEFLRFEEKLRLLAVKLPFQINTFLFYKTGDGDNDPVKIFELYLCGKFPAIRSNPMNFFFLFRYDARDRSVGKRRYAKILYRYHSDNENERCVK